MIAKNRSRFSHGVVHSFTGSTQEALKLVELGLYIGEYFAPQRVTHIAVVLKTELVAIISLTLGINGCSLKTAENLDTVRAIPTERLVIETGTKLSLEAVSV